MDGAALPAKRTEAVSPADPFEQMRQEIDRLFAGFYQGFGRTPHRREWPLPASWTRSGWLKPSVDISSTPNEYTVKVELPGVSEEDVQVAVTGDALRIRGEKRRESEDRGRDYYAVERSSGSFQRVLALPEDADAEQVSAQFKRGVMNINIPRKKSAQSHVKQIEVQTR